MPQEEQNQRVKGQLSLWYQEHAEIKLSEKVTRYAKQMGVSPASVGVKGYRSRWGSCHSDGRVYFNWRIIAAPHSIVDSVVVHELCHLVHLDHSRKFWNLLNTIIPDYAERKAWLKVNGAGLGV
jgi:predicted metal-dependent hydrolase